jgi:hypothetical protein
MAVDDSGNRFQMNGMKELRSSKSAVAIESVKTLRQESMIALGIAIQSRNSEESQAKYGASFLFKLCHKMLSLAVIRKSIFIASIIGA